MGELADNFSRGRSVQIGSMVTSDVRMRFENEVTMRDSSHNFSAQTGSHQLLSGVDIPHDAQAEMSVLSAMLNLYEGGLDEVMADLEEIDFYVEKNRIIYRTMYELHQRGSQITVVTLRDELNRIEQLSKAGGEVYLAEIGDAYGALNVDYLSDYIKILKRVSLQRRLLQASGQIAYLATHPPQTEDELVSESEGYLLSVTDRRIVRSGKTFADLTLACSDNFEELAKRKDKVIGVPTGFTDLDDVTTGLRAGTLNILAARPGIGKSALALNIAFNAARQGVRVIFFSLEMSADDLYQRVLATASGVPLSNMRKGTIKNYIDAIADAWNELNELPIVIDDTTDVTIDDLRTRVRRFVVDKSHGGLTKEALMHGRNPQSDEPEKFLVIVDYLQLMSGRRGKPSENRNLEVSEISRGLKVLAKSLDIPVLALSQFSRGPEQRKGKRPVLADLRDSGSIEQDADLVLFLDRSMNEEEATDHNRPAMNQANLIVAKNRAGAVRDITLFFEAPLTKFSNFTGDNFDNMGI